jgi:phospholipid/cholesterol/gamma-HCH transport system substrate-binding protein
MFNTKDIIVGATALAGIIALVIGFTWINSANLNKHGYSFRIIYGNVNTLMDGAPVMLRGAKIGVVEKLEPSSDNVVVNVRITLNSTQIPKDSIFSVSSKGIIGEKYIQIMPLASRSDTLVQNGDTIIGKDPTNIDDLIESAKVTLTDIKTALANINDVIGDPKLKSDIKSTIAELNKTSKNLADISSSVKDVTSDPATVSKIKDTLTNIDNASKKLDKILNDVDSVTGDKEFRDNLKKSINKLGSVGDGISGLLPTKVKSYVALNDTVNPQNLSRVRPDIGINITNGKKQTLNAEVTDVGRNSLVQLKAGTPLSDSFDLNFGIADSNLAVGSTYHQDALGVSAYLLDPVIPKSQIEGFYWFSPNFVWQAQFRNTFTTGESNISTGVKYNF